MLVKRRVDEELERRKDEIEAEVTRRVEAAKQQMEQEMMAELERRREKAREDERIREVGFATHQMGYTLDTHTNTSKDPQISQSHFLATTTSDIDSFFTPFEYPTHTHRNLFDVVVSYLFKIHHQHTRFHHFFKTTVNSLRSIELLKTA